MLTMLAWFYVGILVLAVVGALTTPRRRKAWAARARRVFR